MKKLATLSSLIGLSFFTLGFTTEHNSSDTLENLSFDAEVQNEIEPAFASEYLQNYLGRHYYHGQKINVRRSLGMNSYYSDREVVQVSVDFYAHQNSSLVLLCDGYAASRPVYINRGHNSTVYFTLTAGRNYLDRNFNSIKILVNGQGVAGNLSSTIGDYYYGGRPIPGPGPIFPAPPGPITPFP